MVDWLAGKRVKGTSSERYGYNNSYPDSLHFSANGQVSDAPTQNATGKVGSYSWSFDGANDYVTLGGSLSNWNFLHNGDSYSIAMWIKFATTGEYEYILADIASSSHVGIIFVKTTNKFQHVIYRGVSSTTALDILSTTTISDTDWHHYAFTFDGTTGRMYVDGSLDSTQTTTNSVSTANSTYSLKLGAEGSGVSFFGGNIDELAIFNRVLTANEVSYLYNSGTGKALTQAISDGEVSVTGLKAYYNFEQTTSGDHLLNIANDYVTPTFDSGTIVNGMSATGNKLISSGVTVNGWSAYIRSNDYVNINDGGGDLYFVGHTYPPSLAIGFEKSPHNQFPSAVYQNANYGWHTTSSTNNIYEKTSNYSATASVNNFQIHKINMASDGTVKYYIGDGFNNMTLYRTSGTTASADNYYINASFSGSSSDIAYVYLYKKTNQITNIQDGTIFEETDTNKAYIWSSSSQTWTQL